MWLCPWPWAWKTHSGRTQTPYQQSPLSLLWHTQPHRSQLYCTAKFSTWFQFPTTKQRCYDPVLRLLYFLSPYPFFDHVTLSVTLPFSRDLRHMVDHLTGHWTYLSHDHLIVLTAYCSIVPKYLLFTFLIVPALLSLTPLFSRPIVRLLRTLSQVAASVVYKLACIIERGLKPDLVFLSKCCCSSNLFCVLFFSLSISSPFGSSLNPSKTLPSSLLP